MKRKTRGSFGLFKRSAWTPFYIFKVPIDRDGIIIGSLDYNKETFSRLEECLFTQIMLRESHSENKTNHFKKSYNSFKFTYIFWFTVDENTVVNY